MTSLDGTVRGGPWDSAQGLGERWSLAGVGAGCRSLWDLWPRSPGARPGPRIPAVGAPALPAGVGGGLPELPPSPPSPASHLSCLLPTRWDEESHPSPLCEGPGGGPCRPGAGPGDMAAEAPAVCRAAPSSGPRGPAPIVSRPAPTPLEASSTGRVGREGLGPQPWVSSEPAMESRSRG